MTGSQHSKSVFAARHQPLVAILLVAGIFGAGIFFLLKRIERGRLEDVDLLSKQSLFYQVDLNHAQWPELVVLPGIGEKLAKSLVNHRTRLGPFRKHEEILNVHGIGEAKLASLKPYLLPISNSH